MILPAHPEDTPAVRWQRLHEQLGQTEDPDERDAILEELDEIEYELGERYLEELSNRRGDIR